MIGFGFGEILILGFLCLLFFAAIITAVFAFVYSVSRNRAEARPAPVVAVVPATAARAASSSSTEPITHLDVIASITKRFCPQCRAPLPTDSPEGLCPACLLAGGMESAVSAEIVDGAALTTPPSGSHPPLTGEIGNLQQHFPQYEILELLGRGGMGAVYKARQKNLDRIVALKVIPPDAAEDPTFAERFAREARALARLNHPNIVTVHDFGHQGVYYLVMEYIDGVNLRQTMRAGRLTPPEALAIVPQICDALQYAHDQGVVHRDIKPENVLLDRSGRVKIADFGLAKLIGKGPDDYTLTRTQQVMGTPRYMAPEQIEKPTTVDHRADIYSLGVVIYEMLTGELPIGRFAAPSERVQLDVRIDQVVLRALEKEPDRRYQRASQVKTELASASSGAGVISPNPTPPVTASALPVPTPIPVVSLPTKPQAIVTVEQSPPSLAAVCSVVIGTVAGLLLTTAGLAALAAYCFVPNIASEMGWHGIYGSATVGQLLWDWLFGSIACLAAGLGCLVGSFSSYHALPGAVNLLRTSQTTWLDWFLRVFGAVGAALLAVGVATGSAGPRQDPLLLWITGGASAVLLAGGFLVARVALRKTAATSELAPRTRLEPPLLLAAGVPTLVFAVIFLALWLDVQLSQPAYDPEVRGAVTHAELFFGTWKRTVLWTGLAVVPLVFALAATWRACGPRSVTEEGCERAPSPFASRWWLVGIGLAGLTTLLLPWFRLDIQPNSNVPLNFGDVFPQQTTLSTVVNEGSLRHFALMPAGWRFAHRGATLIPAVVLATFCAALVFLAALPCPALSNQAFLHSVQNGLAVGVGIVGLILVMSLVHRVADREPTLLVDATTLRGLEKYARDARGQQPQAINRWVGPVSQALEATPAAGMILALAVCGLALLAGVCNFAWGDATAVSPVTIGHSAVAVRPGESPARAAMRKHVAGPAIGLMVTGVLGLAPLLLTCLAAPAFVIHSDVRQHAQSPASPVVRQSAVWLALSFVPQAAATPAPLVAVLPSVIAWQEMRAMETSSQGFTVVRWVMVAVPLFLLNMVFSAVIFLGGWRMRQLKSHGLAMVAAVLALLPCTFGWLIGLPIGIWALIVLNSADVREAFET